MSLYMFSAGSFVSMSNYVDFTRQSGNASDLLTRDIRSAFAVANATTNQLVLIGADGTNTSYVYDAPSRTIKRSHGPDIRTLVKNVSSIAVTLYNKPATNASYEFYTVATPDAAKMVTVKWSCSRTIAGAGTDSDVVQVAMVSLRNK